MNDSVSNKMKTAFKKFQECLDLYDNPVTINNDARIKIYASVTLDNGDIVRATNNFHNKEWFSEVAISMNPEESNDYISDQGTCYGQVILLFK
jgi:hypothetical protein